MKQHYGFQEFDLKATNEQSKMILQSAKEDMRFNELESVLDLSNIRLFEPGEGTVLAVFHSIKDGTFYCIKGSFTDRRFVISDRIFVEKDASNGDKSALIIVKNNEAIRVDLLNGSSEVSYISENVSMMRLLDLKHFTAQLPQNSAGRVEDFTDSEGNHGGDGFCQRERGESFAKCYKAEKDEFCDDMISCLAVDTVPAISILIAAACSCYA